MGEGRDELAKLFGHLSWEEYDGLRIIQNLLSPYDPPEEIHIKYARLLVEAPYWVASLKAAHTWISRVCYFYPNQRTLRRPNKRYPRLSDEQRAKMLAMLAKGMRPPAIAREIGCVTSTVYYVAGELAKKQAKQ